MSRITKSTLQNHINVINRLFEVHGKNTRFGWGHENGMHHVKEFVNGGYRCNRYVGTAREVNDWLSGVQYGLTS